MDDRNNFIVRYFDDGNTYQEILELLAQNHNIIISLRSLKRILKDLGLSRRSSSESSIIEICKAVCEEMFGIGSHGGYRKLWYRIRKTYGLSVKRSTIIQIMRLIDPEGIESRKRRRLRRRKYSVPGPNFLWHLDGYDKLKPFGFAIHGCIDGFSRKLIWLDVATTNNNPRVTAYYYFNSLKKYGIVPTLLRTDKGTENVMIESLHINFRHAHNDRLAGYKSYISGKSTSNQRIESYWSQLWRYGLDFWISSFKSLREDNTFNDSDPLQVELLRFCFGPLIKYDLELIRTAWNNHIIRKQKNVEITGKPNNLFYNPEKIGKKNYRKPIDLNSIDACLNDFSNKPSLYHELMNKFVEILIPDAPIPTDFDSALNLYIKLNSLANQFCLTSEIDL